MRRARVEKETDETSELIPLPSIANRRRSTINAERSCNENIVDLQGG